MQSETPNTPEVHRPRARWLLLTTLLLVAGLTACDAWETITDWVSPGPVAPAEPVAEAAAETTPQKPGAAPEQAKVTPAEVGPRSDAQPGQQSAKKKDIKPKTTAPAAGKNQAKEVKKISLPRHAQVRRLTRAPDTDSPSMTVRKSSVSTSIENRKPVGVSSRFDTSVDMLWAYVGIKNPTEDSHITMVWKLEGRTMSKVKLKVGKSSNWRTWSSKKIKDNNIGNWSVDVVDPSGVVLETMTFHLASKAG